MPGKSYTVTAIIPTLAEKSRADSLLEAIDSLKKTCQENQLTVLVAVNGNRFDDQLLEQIERNDVSVLHVPQSSAPKAIEAARPHVKSEFFCFVDDDDVYIEGAIDKRVRILVDNPLVDIVVSNGYIQQGGIDRIHHTNFATVSKDPFLGIFIDFWLASCGALYRSKTVPEQYFHDPHPYQEWTWLAFRLCNDGKNVFFHDEATYRVHSDTPNSASKSHAYRQSDLDLYQRMLDICRRKDVIEAIYRRISAAHHSRSVEFLLERNVGKAWRHHLLSMRFKGGMRYLTYTARMLLNSFMSNFKRFE